IPPVRFAFSLHDAGGGLGDDMSAMLTFLAASRRKRRNKVALIRMAWQSRCKLVDHPARRCPKFRPQLRWKDFPAKNAGIHFTG
ncbi:MAG: hypothetical protein LCH39_14360, partial [Proteobacteria bacterium]|nr:hypothetical protein [Pseudomonadota bacterium]